MEILVSGSTKTVAKVALRYPENLGILLTPGNRNSVESIAATGLPWAADNGCYHGLDGAKFRSMLARICNAPNLLWVVAPDRVADAFSTCRMFDYWGSTLRASGFRVAFVAQDGQEWMPVPWDGFDCLFIGGSTAWKLGRHARIIAAEAKRRGKWLHMGRANTLRRLRYAIEIGCDSVDGSCFSRWADKFLEWAVRFVIREHAQPTLFA